MKRANNEYRDPEKYLTAIIVADIPSDSGHNRFLKYRGIRNSQPGIDNFEKFATRTFPVKAINYYKAGHFVHQKKFQ